MAFFWRDSLIEGIVGRAEKLGSVALIGAGGIGKTSITQIHSFGRQFPRPSSPQLHPITYGIATDWPRSGANSGRGYPGRITTGALPRR